MYDSTACKVNNWISNTFHVKYKKINRINAIEILYLELLTVHCRLLSLNEKSQDEEMRYMIKLY